MSIYITKQNVHQYGTGIWSSVTDVVWDPRCPFNPEVLGCMPNLKTVDCGCDIVLRLSYQEERGRQLLKTLDWLTYCPQLLELRCEHNFIRSLAGIENCPQLKILDCSINCLQSLAGIEACTQLEVLNCSFNRFDSLEGIQACTLLQELRCKRCRLRSLDFIQSLTQLRTLDCNHNSIVVLDGIEACIQLQTLDCSSNNLESLDQLVYLRQLIVLQYSCNILAVQSIQVQRFLVRFEKARPSISIYSNSQNVHDVHIQKSVCLSIKSLLTDPKPTFSITTIVESKMNRHAVQLLQQYCKDRTIHSHHLLTYQELLSYVWARICKSEHKVEMIRILGQQVLDSEYKCFTGRFNRTLSVLVGFYPDIFIEISDSSRIGAIILGAKDRLELYDSKVHHELAKAALLEAGYDEADVRPWLRAISEP